MKFYSRAWLNNGKRKRSAREKLKAPLDGGGESSDFGRESKVLTLSKLSLDDYPEEQFNSMEVSYAVTGVSSSSISSSGSETEIYTNDEGREGKFNNYSNFIFQLSYYSCSVFKPATRCHFHLSVRPICNSKWCRL